MAKRAERLALVVGITFVAVVGAAYATQTLRSASTDAINACQLRNGLIRIVDVASQCKPGEVPLTWNVQGPPGPISPSRAWLWWESDAAGLASRTHTLGAGRYLVHVGVHLINRTVPTPPSPASDALVSCSLQVDGAYATRAPIANATVPQAHLIGGVPIFGAASSTTDAAIDGPADLQVVCLKGAETDDITLGSTSISALLVDTLTTN